MPKHRRWPPRRVYLVVCDHSIVGTWPTLSAARAAVRLRIRGLAVEVTHDIVGPYVLQEEESK